MRKLVCPQCSIRNFYVKNDAGDILPVFVTTDHKVVTAREGDSTEGFDLETIYCLGCSWSGTPRELKKY